MLAYLTLTAVVAFWFGIKAAKLVFVVLNKHYSVSFYVPKTTIRFSDIGDFETITIANFKTEELQCETARISAYGFSSVTLELDTVSNGADIEKTRLCVYDVAMLSPVSCHHDALTGRSRARYKLPRQLMAGQTVKVWFFN